MDNQKLETDKVVKELSDTIAVLHKGLCQALASSKYEQIIESTPMDISGRYWLMEMLNPLSRKELQSIVDGFLVQLLNADQCRMLVKFLLARFPKYYQDGALEGVETTPSETKPAQTTVQVERQAIVETKNVKK